MGYDSRWGEQKRAQQNFAKAHTPRAVRSGAGGAASGRSSAAVKPLHVRLHATRAYTAQVLDWQRDFKQTLTEVNRLFSPTFGAQLEVSEANLWQPKAGEESIDAVLEELGELDDGAGVDWVVGLIGSVPRFAQSFHELGVANVIGKHLVVRSINNVEEHQAFEAGLTELSREERERLTRVRHAHKVTALLLHELGHTLGAIHERDRSSLMNPNYSDQEDGFSAQAIEIIQIALRHRSTSGGLEREGAKAMVAAFRRGAGPWIDAERQAAIVRLDAAAPVTPSAVGAAASAPSPQAVPVAAIAGLTEADRGLFEAAERLRHAGDLDGARQMALPLFEAYPKVEAVQEFRCQLAMQTGGAWQRTRAECEGLLKLAPNRTSK